MKFDRLTTTLTVDRRHFEFAAGGIAVPLLILYAFDIGGRPLWFALRMVLFAIMWSVLWRREPTINLISVLVFLVAASAFVLSVAMLIA